MAGGEFLAAAATSKEVLKTARLIKSLSVNALITGEEGTGKSLLARQILPDAPVVDGKNREELKEVLLRSPSVIVERFDLLIQPERLDLEGKRIVATASKGLDQRIVDRFFGITLFLPPFRERPEDVQPLAGLFLEEAAGVFMVDELPDLEMISLDLSHNAHSLKRSIYMALLMGSMGEGDLVVMMEKFLLERMDGLNVYRDFLYLYDKPLIEAGLKKYGSQLKLSQVLGINRNTLRKKIYELGIDH